MIEKKDEQCKWNKKKKTKRKNDEKETKRKRNVKEKATKWWRERKVQKKWWKWKKKKEGEKWNISGGHICNNRDFLIGWLWWCHRPSVQNESITFLRKRKHNNRHKAQYYLDDSPLCLLLTVPFCCMTLMPTWHTFPTGTPGKQKR